MRSTSIKPRRPKVEILSSKIKRLQKQIEELNAKQRQLEDDINVYANSVIVLEDSIAIIRAMLDELYNPYNKQAIKQKRSQPPTYPTEAMATVRRYLDKQFEGFEKAIQFRDKLREKDGDVNITINR